MRSPEINQLFRVCGITNVCEKLCDNGNLKNYFRMDDRGKVSSELVAKLEEFFKRRNGIAHSLNVRSSFGQKTLNQDMFFFCALARDLSVCLEETLK